MRFRVEAVHGESASLFHIIDTHAPESDQPAIRRTFKDRECADIYAKEANRLDTEEARGFMLAADIREAERIRDHVREEVACIMVDEMMGEDVEHYIADAAAEAACRAFVDQFSFPTRPKASGLYLPVDANGRIIGPDPGDAGMRPGPLCVDCNGTGMVPAIGPEEGETDGYVTCPTCREGGAS